MARRLLSRDGHAQRRRLRRASTLALVLLTVVVACESEGRRAPWSDMYSLEVRSNGQVVATWTLWGSWDVQGLPPLPPGDWGTPETLWAAAYDLNGEAIPISAGQEHSIGYRLVTGAVTGVLDLDRAPSELYEEGVIRLFRAGGGTTQIEITLIQGGRVRQWTTPLTVEVTG